MESKDKKEGKKRKKQSGIEKYLLAGPSKNSKKSANDESVQNESNVLENSNENTAQTNDENQNSPEVLERPENLIENTVETNDESTL
mgnify:CR=1 FL=1